MKLNKSYTAKEAIKLLCEAILIEGTPTHPYIDLLKRVKPEEVDLFRKYYPSVFYIAEMMSNQYKQLSILPSVKFSILNLQSSSTSMILLLNPKKEEGQEVENLDLFIKNYVEETKTLKYYELVEIKVSNNQYSVEMHLETVIRQLNEIVKHTAFIKAFIRTFDANIKIVSPLELGWEKEYLYFYKDQDYFKKLEEKKSFTAMDFLGEYELPKVEEVKQIAKMYEDEYLKMIGKNINNISALNGGLTLPEPIAFIKEYSPYTMDFLLERVWVKNEE